MRKLILIGYWHDAGWSSLPHPQSLVDPEWEKDRRAKIVAYLEAGKTAATYFGVSYCRFGCKGWGGTRDLTDGYWVWPELLAHYVEGHQIKLPGEFVKHAALRHFKGREMVVLPDNMHYDFTFWTE